MYNPYMLVNLKNIHGNAEALKKASGGKKLCAVIKADAYRHGAIAVAQETEDIADMFAVATTFEAASLRYAGVKKDILVLSPVGGAEEAKRLLSLGIIFTVSSFECLERINSAARAMNAKARAHIKINTGMNRYGFSVEDVASGRLSCAAKNSGDILFEGIYSHFYNASCEDILKRQYLLFRPIALYMQDALRVPLIKHMASTGAVAAWGDRYSFDMVRCGLGLYGYSPVKGNIRLKAAEKLFAPVAERRKYLFGGAGYGGEYRGRERNFSTLRFGYADALPFINSLCMDAFVLPCKGKNDYICVLYNAQKTAEKYGVSIYKVLCSVSERVERRYVYD